MSLAWWLVWSSPIRDLRVLVVRPIFVCGFLHADEVRPHSPADQAPGCRHRRLGGARERLVVLHVLGVLMHHEGCAPALDGQGLADGHAVGPERGPDDLHDEDGAFVPQGFQLGFRGVPGGDLCLLPCGFARWGL